MHIKFKIINKVIELLSDSYFQSSHKVSPNSFTRERKLPFKIMALLLMKKSLKSIQLVLNEFFFKNKNAFYECFAGCIYSSS